MERAPVPDEPARERDEDAESRVGPMMEAPDVSATTPRDEASWNPAQGDRSFGFGSGAQPPGSPDAAEGSRPTSTADDAP